MVDEPALTALNMRLRDDYTADCAKGVERWNKIIEKHRRELPARTAACRLPPPDRRVQATSHASPDGHLLIDDATGPKARDQWLPSKADGDFIDSADEAGRRARQVRRLDRAAEGRHRQQARRLRVCEDRGVAISLSRARRRTHHPGCSNIVTGTLFVRNPWLRPVKFRLCLPGDWGESGRRLELTEEKPKRTAGPDRGPPTRFQPASKKDDPGI